MKKAIKNIIFVFFIMVLSVPKIYVCAEEPKIDKKDLFKVASTSDSLIIIYGDDKDDKDTWLRNMYTLDADIDFGDCYWQGIMKEKLTNLEAAE